MGTLNRRPGFWSPEAKSLLLHYGRQDLVDRGDALAQRVTALITTAQGRLDKYIEYGDLYNNKGGASDLTHPHSLMQLEEFVNVRLRDEIEALENLLNVFDDFNEF